jgi:hypothetical protein
MALFSQSQLCLGAPDCPVVHRTVSGVPDWLRRTRCSREEINGVRLKFTGLSGVHQTAGEPTVGRANGRLRDPRETRDRANGREGASDCPVCTGQCPVRQATEGKNCFPGLLSTAPSCLGDIKGTPRRMEEYTKHSLSTLDHSHSILAHLFDILVI